jgi:hypothetical protein
MEDPGRFFSPSKTLTIPINTSPVAEIPSVVHALCTSSPRVQREALETFFLPSASFDHPIVRVEPLTSPVPSRSIILGIYRWYKIISPHVDLRVESVG